jgi:translation initiation factor IF-2
VAQGRIHRNAQITLYRDDQKIYEGPVASLKRFKDDVREVQEGFECGVVLKDFSAIQEGDVLDVFEVEKIARRL